MSEKWWDMSDDELDDLFREASDRVDVPFDSSAYNKLRQKIAEQPKSEPPKGFKKRWLLLLAGLFLMVGVGLVYRFGSDLRENNSTKIAKNIDTKNTVKPTLLPVSPQTTQKNNFKTLSVETQTTTGREVAKNIDTENKIKPLNVSSKTKKGSEILKSVNKNEVSIVEKENIVEKSANPFSMNSRIKENSNSEQLFVKKQGIKNANSLINQTDRKPEQSEAKANEIYSHTKTEGELLGISEKTVENKQVSSQSTLLSLSSQTTHKTMKPLSVETQTITQQNKVIENLYFDSKNNKKQLYRFNNSKNNKDREGKNYPINPNIMGENTLPIIENLSDIPEKIVAEETINKTNFYDVNFLKNKDSKSLLIDIHTELPDYVDSLPRTMKPLKFSRFGLRLVLSPDFNSIENLGKMALGGSVGLLFEYKISKKLIVQTGMIYSKKSYIGSFDDYHNWTEWKTYHPSKPTEVDGGCKVVDIPINLRLNLFQKPKQTWFVSSGISSYWMVNESYTYLYAWSPSKTADWSDDSKYYFSVLNFSVGLERQISKRFSLQVEPYLKTPLKNVGRGGVNLYSSGVLFSTKYEF